MKFGVFIKRTIYIPGDERSRTHPGHGYPESTETAIDFKSFSDEEALVKYLTEQEKRLAKDNITGIIKYEELEISKEVKVSVR